MMRFKSPLEEALIIKRYKRFFADVQLPSGEAITVHVPNTGPMIGAWEPGLTCYILPKENPKKLKYGIELVEAKDGALIGINTQNPNRIVKEALGSGRINTLQGYSFISEFKIGKSRLDFKLSKEGEKDCFIEVKNCSGKVGDTAFFPDCRSERAVKHLEELISLKKKGFRTVLIILVQRSDVNYFAPGDKYHPEYGALFRKAIKLGVEIKAFSTIVSTEGLLLGPEIEIKI